MLIRAGDIIKGPFWAEIVEIKRCEPIDQSLFLVEAIGRQTREYYETYLELHQIESLELLQQNRGSSFKVEHIFRYLQYYVLKADERYSKSRVRGNKQVIPLPHQIEAVYSRMLQTTQVRFLLADDPGAGKTIMAGMLIRELLARQSVKRVLILVPPLVLRQWQEELHEKFSEEFTIINRTTLRDSGEQNPFELHDKCLTSLYWAMREDVKNYLIRADFDLVIVDEAHKMAAYTHGVKRRKIQRTKMYQLGEALLRGAEHCLLLTATPHKGDKENFRHLMNLIDHDLFSNLNSKDSLYEKSNPFVIRRLKESMVSFEGTPLFPKRTTQTITFSLSSDELDLYNEVTAYVRLHFNRAKGNNNHSTAFAMMLLQRRLSSSIEAIYLSLVRRKERLEDLLRAELQQDRLETAFSIDDYEDATPEEQDELERAAEGETDALDLYELQVEIEELTRLIRKANGVRLADVERKYFELESTLFGPDALLARGERILIFTESKDTLHYLEQRLLAHVPQVAKIIGDFSMDRRREEIDKFREQTQIMLATDAGGESINLQFCNQMINYDIPWNPNKLEQRMGRIHRIGQRNEVFVFNLVAINTREGEVMKRLLEKMEQMRDDLGKELVYDFIGDVLEEEDIDLANLMEQAITGRENLDDIIAKMEKRLSEEHQRLLELAREERLDDQGFDLPGVRRSYNELVFQSLPNRVYGQFALEQLRSTHLGLNISADQSIIRIDRIPKSIREFGKRNKILLSNDGSYRFTVKEEKETDEITLLQNDNPFYKLALAFSEQDMLQISIPFCSIRTNSSEPLTVELNEISFVDGTGRELERRLMLLAKRASGEYIYLAPYWLFSNTIKDADLDGSEDATFKAEVIKQARFQLITMRVGREELLNRKSQFLRGSFDAQVNTLYERLQKYQIDDVNHRNSALINQTLSQIEELEERRNERLEEIERERSIQLRPIKRVAQFYVEPKDSFYARLIPNDYEYILKEYEAKNGRFSLTMLPAYGLVDFISENAEGEGKYIILTKDEYNLTKDLVEQDYSSIMEQIYIYRIEDGHVLYEVPLQYLLR